MNFCPPTYNLSPYLYPATPPTFSGLLKKIHPTYNLPPHLYPATPPIPHHTPYTLPSQLYPATSHIPRHPTFTLPPTALESALLVYLSTYDRVSTFRTKLPCTAKNKYIYGRYRSIRQNNSALTLIFLCN